MLAVMITESPEKSTKVTRPGRPLPGLEMATAYLLGWAAGPTGLIALMTGRYWFPQPTSAATAPTAANETPARRAGWARRIAERVKRVTASRVLRDA